MTNALLKQNVDVEVDRWCYWWIWLIEAVHKTMMLQMMKMTVQKILKEIADDANGKAVA